jgi:hypothetical protein
MRLSALLSASSNLPHMMLTNNKLLLSPAIELPFATCCRSLPAAFDSSKRLRGKRGVVVGFTPHVR